MLTHPTIDLLRTLKLDGMAEAFVELQSQDRARELDHAEWLALLLDREAANRGAKRFQSRLRSARLRHGQACVEDVDFRTARRLDKGLFQQLAAGRWIAEHRNLLITGPCGIGKSWLSCALAQKACRDGHTVFYARVPRLFADLELAHGDGRFTRLFRMLTKVAVLVLDDWGPDRLTASQRRDLMEIIEDRYGAGSTLITSQLPVEAWHGDRRADLRRRHSRSAGPQRLPTDARWTINARSQDRQGADNRAGRGHREQRGRDEAGGGAQEMTAMPSTLLARDDAKVFRQDAVSCHEGYQAGYRGSLATCPYAAGTNESWSWSSGIIEGKAARLESCQHKIDVNREH